MNQVFADTSFFVAFLNARDVDHAVAAAHMARYEGQIITTDWILVELGNFLARCSNRNLFTSFVHDLPTDPRMEILPADRKQFDAGCALYESRSDKAWSMTDCISMVVINQRAICDVLTADHHFEQAGYNILLK